MKTLHVNDILGKNLERVTTGSELLLLYEINKYAKLLLSQEASTEGIEVVSLLEGCEHYSYVMSNGFTFGKVLTSEDREKLKEYDAQLYFNKTVEGVELRERNETRWVYDRYHNTFSNNFLHNSYRSHAYVSLVAYMMVVSYRDDIKPTLLIDNTNHAELEFEYVDLLILKDWGNKLLADLIEINFSDDRENQPGWQTYLTVNRQRGYMIKEYSKAEKMAYLKKNFKQGDVVLLYFRDLDAQGKILGKLTNCYPAVIRGGKDGLLTLNYYPIPQTLLTRQIELSNMLDKSDEDETIYTEQDATVFPESKLTIDINDLGVDKCMLTENVFILKPFEFDGSCQYFETESGLKRYWLNTVDTIYAVFEDRGVKYNKTRFLDAHFYSKNLEPMYDAIQNGKLA